MSHVGSTIVLGMFGSYAFAQLPRELFFSTLVPIWLLPLLNSTVTDPGEMQEVFLFLSSCKCVNTFINRLSLQMSQTTRSSQKDKNVSQTIFCLQHWYVQLASGQLQRSSPCSGEYLSIPRKEEGDCTDRAARLHLEREIFLAHFLSPEKTQRGFCFSKLQLSSGAGGSYFTIEAGAG